MTTERTRLLRATSLDQAGSRLLQRRHRAGQLVRITDGVYVDAHVWRDISSTEQHLLIARALAPQLRDDAAFSHLTAAIAYGWPLIGPPPQRVHVTDGATCKTEHRAHLVRHAGSPETGTRPSSFAGVRLTSALRTAVDLATTLDPSMAAVAIDHAVRRGTLSVGDFEAALPMRPRRGSVRCRTVAASLDPLHESVGESYAAVRMVELGFPRPAAQHEFRHAGGAVDRVDFWFEDTGVVVEFDGKQKYTDRGMLAGRAPGEAVWHEKIREDRIRSVPGVTSVVRPTWWHLVDPDRLRALFRQHRIIV